MYHAKFFVHHRTSDGIYDAMFSKAYTDTIQSLLLAAVWGHPIWALI